MSVTARKKLNLRPIQVLIISRDLEHQGGVVDTVKMLLKNLDESINAQHFAFGRRAGQDGFLGYLQPFVDVFSLAYFLLFNKFDVVHVNPSLNVRSFLRESMLLLLLKIFGYNGRVLVFFHGWNPVLLEQITANSVSHFAFRSVLSVAGKITVLSSKYQDSLASCGLSKSRLEVASSMFSRGDVPDKTRLNLEAPTLLFLSRMVRQKGVYELLDAFEILAQHNPAVKLIFAGDGPERRKLEAEALSRGLVNIKFPGFLRGEDKKIALAESDVFVLPTMFSEGCPVSLLEAMGAGLVPVVPLAGGIEDVVTPGKDAVILPEVTSEEIVNAINFLLKDPDAFKAISAEACSISRANYEAGAVSLRISEIYKDLAKVRAN